MQTQVCHSAKLLIETPMLYKVGEPILGSSVSHLRCDQIHLAMHNHMTARDTLHTSATTAHHQVAVDKQKPRLT